MRKLSRSYSSKRRRPRTAQRPFHPWVESLEDRRLLAVDPLLFIEDFSLDSDHQQPGFDQADDDSGTPPDRLLIQHTIQARDTAFVSVESVDLSSSYQPSPPFALGMLGPASDNIHLPPIGNPGGLASGEELTAVAIGYSGLGTIRVFGDNGVKTFNVFGPPSVWHSLTITANSPSDTGQELGAILSVSVSTFEVIYIDDIALLVNGIISNNPPTANADFVSTLPGVPVQIDALANDGDADGDAIRLVRIEPVSTGSGTLSFQDGGFHYTPSAGFRGIAAFNYFITDDRIPVGSEVMGTVHITVNTPPPAPAVLIPVPHGHRGPFTFDAGALLAGGTDADGNPLTIASFESPWFGSLTRNADGTFTYFPTESNGLVADGDQFKFRLWDTFIVGDEGVAELDANKWPLAQSQTLSLSHGTPGPLRGTLHFSDPDGDALELTVVDAPADPVTGFFRTAHGVLVIHHGLSLSALTGNVEFSYFPDSGDLRGDDRFTFKVTDFYGGSGFGTIELQVPNYRPEIIPAASGLSRSQFGGVSLVTPAGNATLAGQLFEHTSSAALGTLLFDPHLAQTSEDFYLAVDLDGDSLTAVLADPPSYGTVELQASGAFSYTPFPGSGLFGADTFSYRVSDGVSVSEDVIYVVIAQSFGSGMARSDIFWTEDYDIGPFPGAETPTDFVTINSLTLLSNDRFDTGLVAAPYARGLELHRGSLYPVRISDDRVIGCFTCGEEDDSDPFIERDDAFRVRAGVRVESGETTYVAMTYEFLYSPPGLPDSVAWEELAKSTTATILIAVSDEPQGDPDGVLDAIEQHGPGNGDGNSDGVPDGLQSHVATLTAGLFTNTSSDQWVTLVSGGQTSLFNVKSVPNPSPADTPNSYQFPLGFFSFNVVGLAPGEATTVTLIPHSSVQLTTFYMYGRETGNQQPHWYRFDYDGQTGAEIIRGADGTVSQVVLHFVDGLRGDEDLRANGLIDDPGGPAVFVPPAPTVESVIINDGHAQRSMIRSITVLFGSPVTIESGAFELYQRGTKRPLPVQVRLSQSNDRTLAVLTFKSHRTVGGSLANGHYRLTIRADKIRDAAGRQLDGDGNGSEGGNYVDEFFRLFGDTNGDGKLDAADKRVLKSAYGNRSNQPGYLWYLDFNSNGRIWAEDAALFLLGYCHSNRRR